MRRRIYPERGRYQMIGASVTEDGWLEGIPADPPVLIVAEGLLPYLTPSEARRLLQRLTDHFASGELVFDGVAPWMVGMIKIFQWSPRDGGRRALEPPPHLRGTVPITPHHRRIPVRRYRILYRLMDAVAALRNSSAEYRFTFCAGGAGEHSAFSTRTTAAMAVSRWSRTAASAPGVRPRRPGRRRPAR